MRARVREKRRFLLMLSADSTLYEAAKLLRRAGAAREAKRVEQLREEIAREMGKIQNTAYVQLVETSQSISVTRRQPQAEHLDGDGNH